MYFIYIFQSLYNNER